MLHFATIITPDADPAQRQGMLAVLQQFFAERNARQMSPSPRMRSGRVVSFMVHRQWQLHVWELTGPEDTWAEQLERRMAKEPVFAVLSGLAGRNWAPVHRFCERARVPCLFPNVEAPVDAERDFYPVYFSRGVLLEADLIGSRILTADSSTTPKVVHQILRAKESGEAGAAALAALLASRGVRVQNHVLTPTAAADAVAAAVRAAGGAASLVLWLRPPDLAALADPPPAATTVFMSGLLGRLEAAPLPAAWRARTSIAYPFDLPERRRVRVDFALGWFRIRHVPLVAEQVQVDTYLACSLVSEILNHVSDTFVREYLVERIEDMLAHRILTGFYPRLTLAPGQRFASKGGYMVRFADTKGTKLVAETDWVVPAIRAADGQCRPALNRGLERCASLLPKTIACWVRRSARAWFRRDSRSTGSPTATPPIPRCAPPLTTPSPSISACPASRARPCCVACARRTIAHRSSCSPRPGSFSTASDYWTSERMTTWSSHSISSSSARACAL